MSSGEGEESCDRACSLTSDTVCEEFCDRVCSLPSDAVCEDARDRMHGVFDWVPIQFFLQRRKNEAFVLMYQEQSTELHVFINKHNVLGVADFSSRLWALLELK